MGVETDGVRVSRARVGVAVACVAAVGTPAVLATASTAAADTASFAIRLITALLAVTLLLLRAARTPGAPVASARLFAVALAAGALAAGIALLSTTGIVSKAVADAVYLSHVPFAGAALLMLPVSEAGVGARLRAFLDGAVAACALAFIVLVLVPTLTSGDSDTAMIMVLATADVFLLATALSLLPRVVPQLRRFLVLTSFGLVLIGTANLQKAIALGYGPVSSHGLRTALLEVALLLMVAGAAHPVRPDRGIRGWRWSALAPFTPAAVAIVVASVVLASGRMVTPAQLGVGILTFFALLIRQSVASWDSAQLLERLRQRENAYREQALEDQLTGLPNRRAFLQAVESELTGRRTPTLLLVDCDDFKSINDTQGHATGDAVLRHVARQMQAAVGSRGTVARLGGDEFGILLRVDEAQSLLLALQVRAAAGAPLQIGHRSVTPSVSVGGATARAHNESVSALLAHADVALYRAKGGIEDGVVVLDDAGRTDAAGDLRLRDDLATPELSEFRVVYQPLFDGATGEICSAEALLRWDHPTLGCVSPAVFIPLAEQTGAIDAIGDFVLQQALQQLAMWRRDDPDGPLAMSVNVSPRQLADPYFATKTLRLVAAAGLQPSQLIVEITEQAFVRDLAPMAAAARTLRAAGVQLAVDDFGTGYSSLRYLEHIPSDILKIDRSYVAASTESPAAAALIRGLLALARELGLQSVAEGVETPEQLTLLRELGCNTMQGYLLGRPASAEALTALLAGARTRRAAAGVMPLPRRAPASRISAQPSA